MKKLKVGVIFGGPSGEHEVSRQSAKAIVEGLDVTKYDVLPIAVGYSGKWYCVEKEDVGTFEEERYLGKEVALLPHPGGKLYDLATGKVAETIDVVVPIIHGPYGEDGRLQGLLDLCRLPYVGAGVAASALGMDKVLMRSVLEAHKVAQVDYVVVYRDDFEENAAQVLDDIEERLQYPIFVKPANLGSSVGISRAVDRESLVKALEEAALYDRKLMVEQGIEKREIEVAVLGNKRLSCAPAGEIFPGAAFYDYSAKYQDATSRTEVPADLTKEQQIALEDIACKVYRLLDIQGMARVDFFIEKETDRILLNEVNTLPGFTSISMYAKMWQQTGMDLTNLLDALIQLALERAEDNKRNAITKITR